MLKRLFSTEAKPGAFFRRIDWMAFWSATAISFLVYFLTLGPSVGLEDSGELTTAADHLGVPHPPGYPFWTLCCWIFCRAFSFVTYMGQPTPAWAVSLFSAVVGAFAAGCTAMLICRSGSDMLDSMDSDGAADAPERVPPADTARRHALMSFAGGLGGALLFAFSPVEWSQSTIVEIYSLNALFLMAVFLLSYRWMRRPSHRILWLIAFVFGLGLTNYQVLLMAALPLAVIIFFRDIRLFRDFTLILIPIALTVHVLQIGSKMRASAGMAADVINKFEPVLVADSCPNVYLLWTAFALVVAAPVVGKALAVLTRRRGAALCGALVTGLSGVALIALANTVFADTPALVNSIETVVEGLKDGTLPCTWTSPDVAPLLQPAKYAWIALFLAAACVLSLGAVFAPDDAPIYRFRVWIWLAGAGACAAAAVRIALLIRTAGNAGYRGEAFGWTIPVVALVVGLALLVALALLTPRQRGLAFALPVASVQLVAFILLYKGAMNGLTHPATWWFFWPCIWNFVMLGLAVVALPNGRAIGVATLFAELGVSFYAYMPIVSDLRNPPMNWGYPRTWEGFKHAIMRGQYEAITIPYLFKPKGFNNFIHQIDFYFKDLGMQFTAVVAALALVPFALWTFAVRLKNRARPIAVKAVSGSSLLYVALAALVIAFTRLFTNLNGGMVPARLDDWLIAGMAILATAGVYLMLRHQAKRIFSSVLPWPAMRAWSAIALLGLSAGVMAWIFFTCLAGRGFAGGVGFFSLDVATAEQIKEGLACEPKPEAVKRVMAASLAAFLLFAAEIVRLVLARASRRRKPIMRAGVLLDDVSQQWLIAVGSCFAIMSFFLVALAGVKGDIQDGFIQKVKFISSHGMFSLWIGYGLIIGLLVAHRLVSHIRWKWPRRVVFGILCACAVGVAFIPVYENYTNDRLVFEMGCAEQNGHTFGWQFGNYQLRGAYAIREELAPDEEPLPNPLWPEEMEPSSIFFGGTDPGRFVPTYMIYSAKVRPDVYLITQNALADDTYMSVMRDLYGDDIWIPSKDDSSDAFTEYVNSLSPEACAAKGIVTENGRVQVTGALSVMEINGILVKKMFNHERLRHDFYVEESYVIPWMYDYLTPHGLIMKLNNVENQKGLKEWFADLCKRANGNPGVFIDEIDDIEKTLRDWHANLSVFTKGIARNDMEFWDWYTRRLLRDPAFRRDFAAQKSFSKLRAAIAGLYENKGNMYAETSHVCRRIVRIYEEIQTNMYAQMRRMNIPYTSRGYGEQIRKIEKALRLIRAIAANIEGSIEKNRISSEQAYDEAVALFPISPEAVFRRIPNLVLDGKWDAILDMVDYMDRKDPNNARTEGFRKHAQAARDAEVTMTDLLRKHAPHEAEGLPDAALVRFRDGTTLKRLSEDEQGRLADACLDYAEAMQNLPVKPECLQNAYTSAIWLQDNPALAKKFERLKRSADIFKKFGLFQQAATNTLEALKFPEADTYDVQHEAAIILASANCVEDSAQAIQAAMMFPESQKFDVLLQYANTLMRFGKKTDAAWTLVHALHFADTAKPDRLFSAVELLLAIDAAKYAPFVSKLVLDPLRERTETSWGDVQRIAAFYEFSRRVARTSDEASDYEGKAIDCYSQLAEAMDDGRIYETLAGMYANAAPSKPDDDRQQARRKEKLARLNAAQAYVKLASSCILSRTPDLQTACYLVREAKRADSNYVHDIHETYMRNSGHATNAIPLHVDRVKDLLVSKALGSSQDPRPPHVARNDATRFFCGKINKWRGIAMRARRVAIAFFGREFDDDDAYRSTTAHLLETGRHSYRPDGHRSPVLHYVAAAVQVAAGRHHKPIFHHAAEVAGQDMLSMMDGTLLRLVPFLFGVLALVFGFLALRKLIKPHTRFGGWLVPFLFVTVLGTAPVFAFLSTDFTPEMPLACFTLMMFWAGLGYVHSRKTPSESRDAERRPVTWAILFGSATALAFAAKETCALSFAAAALAALPLLVKRLTVDALRARARDIAVAVLCFFVVACILYSDFGRNFSGVYNAFIAAPISCARRAAGPSDCARPWWLYAALLFRGQYLFAAFAASGVVTGCLSLLAGGRGQIPRALKTGFAFTALYALVLVALYSAIPCKTPSCALQMHVPIVVASLLGWTTFAVAISTLVPKRLPYLLPRKLRLLAYLPLALIAVHVAGSNAETLVHTGRHPCFKDNPFNRTSAPPKAQQPQSR